jgi:penicillin-binding protein 1A
VTSPQDPQARPGRPALHARIRWPLVRQLSLVVLAAFGLFVLMHVPFTPSASAVRQAREQRASVMLSADGKVLAEFKDTNQQWVPLRSVSPYVVQALIATEDRRFYDHWGVDPRRIVGAAWNSLHGDRQGGSTITQQLARNLYPREIGNDATLTRKVREAVTALKIEAGYSKQEILETYLNTVPFLYNATGIEMAARTYFDKPAARLDLLESATLVAMLKGTSQYNPVQHADRALQRRNLVLAQMAQHGDIAPTAVRALAARPIRLKFEQQRETPGPAPHLAQQVRRWLAEWAGRKGYSVQGDGLVVRTTLLAPLQEAANAAVDRQMQALRPLAAGVSRTQPLQAGFVAIDPRDGHVLAWVGSADFGSSQFDHVSQAKRQPGSTFKPFVYGAAFANGMRPGDILLDVPVAIRNGKDTWSPKDATPPTGQPMTLADGLAVSRNSITAQVMQKVGPAKVARLAREMGVRESPLDAVPSLALGTSPVTLKEMVAAYGSIANGGRYIVPVIVTQVEDRSGRVLERFATKSPDRAMKGDAALVLLDAMRGVVDRGTARAIRDRYGIVADVAGKTGTTQDNTDGWFLLMHPQLVAGAWVGFDDSRLSMGDRWGPGASSALPIVADVFVQALRGRVIDGKAGFGHPENGAPPPPVAAAPAVVAQAANGDDDQDEDQPRQRAGKRHHARGGKHGHHRGHGHRREVVLWRLVIR